MTLWKVKPGPTIKKGEEAVPKKKKFPVVSTKIIEVWSCTYNDKDDLKNGTSFVPSPVRITEESPNKREDVDRPGPFAYTVGCIGIVLLQNSCQEQHQVHTNPKERKSCKTLIHCIIGRSKSG